MDPNQYIVTLNPNGGICSESSLTATFDQPLILPNPSREGYRFGGWFYGDKSFMSGDIYTYDANITLIARWNDLYTIYLDTNGGDAINPIGMHSTVIDYLPTPQKENASFMGWYRNGEEFTVPYDNTRYEDIYLVAHWREEIDDYIVINNGDGTATIAGCADYVTQMNIPTYLNNEELTVTRIAPEAFKNNDKLTSVAFPCTIEEIGDSAFENCTKLYSALLDVFDEDIIVHVGNNVFKGCKDLYFISIPCFDFSLMYLFGYDEENIRDKLYISLIYSTDYTPVKDGLFKDLSFPKIQLDFQAYWRSIPSDMCKGCRCLTSVSSSAEFIGESAFENCQNIMWLYFGEMTNCGLREIGDNAFKGCKNLLLLLFDDKLYLENIHNGAFDNCPSLDNIFIKGNMDRWANVQIGHNNDSVSHATVKRLGEYGLSSYAFPELDDYELLTFYMDVYGFKYYHSGEVESIVDLQSLVMSFNIITLAYRAFYGNTDIQRVVLPDTVESIGREAFRGCSNLNFINFPSSLTHINDNAFRSTALTSIDIPDSVTYIGPNAFEGCKELEEVHLGNGITEINGSLFYGCSSIKSITIPSSVKSIGTNAFEGCTSMASIVLPTSLEFVASGAFINCPMLRSVYYMGTSEEWNNVNITYSDNNALDTAHIYFYSETQTGPGASNYWNYVDGVPTSWN